MKKKPNLVNICVYSYCRKWIKNKNCNDIIHAAWKMTNQTQQKYIRKLKQKNIYTNVHPHNGSANSTLN